MSKLPNDNPKKKKPGKRVNASRARSIPLDADTIIRDALEDALHRLENSRATRKGARPEWSAHR